MCFMSTPKAPTPAPPPAAPPPPPPAPEAPPTPPASPAASPAQQDIQRRSGTSSLRIDLNTPGSAPNPGLNIPR